MARQVFYSFHYNPDNWRVSQLRNIGMVEGNQAAKDNDWETVTKGGDAAIQRWIDAQMMGRSCAIVLIGKDTAGWKWINYEIKKAWTDGKGVLGIYIHALKDVDQRQTTKGSNPFIGINVGGVALAQVVKTYDPSTTDSKAAYAWIANNLGAWIEEAIKIRGQY